MTIQKIEVKFQITIKNKKNVSQVFLFYGLVSKAESSIGAIKKNRIIALIYFPDPLVYKFDFLKNAYVIYMNR